MSIRHRPSSVCVCMGPACTSYMHDLLGLQQLTFHICFGPGSTVTRDAQATTAEAASNQTHVQNILFTVCVQSIPSHPTGLEEYGPERRELTEIRPTTNQNKACL